MTLSPTTSTSLACIERRASGTAKACVSAWPSPSMYGAGRFARLGSRATTRDYLTSTWSRGQEGRTDTAEAACLAVAISQVNGAWWGFAYALQNCGSLLGRTCRLGDRS